MSLGTSSPRAGCPGGHFEGGGGGGQPALLHRKFIRSHTNLFSAHSQTRAFDMTFDPSSRMPKNRYISGNAWAIPMQLISKLCGK